MHGEGRKCQYGNFGMGGGTVPVLPYPGSLLLVQAWRRGEGDVKLSASRVRSAILLATVR